MDIFISIVIILGWLVVSVAGMIDHAWWGFLVFAIPFLVFAAIFFSARKQRPHYAILISFLSTLFGLIFVGISVSLKVGDQGFEKTLQYAVKSGNIAQLRQLIVENNKNRYRGDRAIDTLSNFLETRSPDDSEYKKSMESLYSIMADTKAALHYSAEQTVLRLNKKNIIIPTEAYIEKSVRNIIGHSTPPIGDNAYRPMGDLIYMYEGHFSDDLFLGKTPNQVREYIERISSICFIKETRQNIGIYINRETGTKYSDALQIHWDVWIINLRTRAVTAYSHLVGSRPRERFTSEEETSSNFSLHVGLPPNLEAYVNGLPTK